MKALAFGFQLIDWDRLQDMSFSSIMLCLKQASEWSQESAGMAGKAARRRGR
jgi:hypothetical protein